MWMFNGYGMGAAGWLLMAVFWVAVFAIIVWAVLKLFPSRSETTVLAQASTEAPREILDRRLAHGEIDVATYERLSAKLDPRSTARR
jgi:putative membrane protein